MLTRHWGITVDSEVPVTGVVNSNAVEFIDDDINDGIVWSKTTQRVKLCYPGQGDLGNPSEYLAFDLPADMYGDKDKV